MVDLKEFRKVNGLKQDDLVEFFGVAKSFISQVENGKSRLPESKLSKLINNDRGWDTSALMSDEDAMKRDIDSVRVTVPVLPIAAQAGGMSIAESVALYDCEQAISPVPGTSLIVPIYGDSMDPEYPSGSRVAVRQVDASMFIEWGKTYVVDTYNGAVLKVVNEGKNADSITCHSLNSKFSDFQIRKKDIIALYRVLMVMIPK